MNNLKIVLSILMLLVSTQAMAQQTTARAEPSSKYRKIFTIAGAGGGFAVGLFAGASKLDDAVNSDEKVTLAALGGAAVGAVGGYFLGRFLDHRRDRTKQPTVQRTVQASPLLDKETRGLRLSFSF